MTTKNSTKAAGTKLAAKKTPTTKCVEIDQGDQKLIARLREEAAQHCEDGRKEGLGDGYEWAYVADLVDLRRVCESGEALDANGLLLIQAGYDRHWDPDHFIELGAGSDRLSFMAGYVPGFREGARKVWAMVRSHLPS